MHHIGINLGEIEFCGKSKSWCIFLLVKTEHDKNIDTPPSLKNRDIGMARELMRNL